MVETTDGHIYKESSRPITEVGEAIAEEFENWSYKPSENKIYQKTQNPALRIGVWFLMLFSVVLLFVILPIAGLVVLVGLIIIHLIWGDLSDTEEAVDYITISERSDGLKYTTHVDLRILDADGYRNFEDEDIMGIINRIDGVHSDETNIELIETKEQ